MWSGCIMNVTSSGVKTLVAVVRAGGWIPVKNTANPGACQLVWITVKFPS